MEARSLSEVWNRYDNAGRASREPDVGIRFRVGSGSPHWPRALCAKMHPVETRTGV